MKGNANMITKTMSQVISAYKAVMNMSQMLLPVAEALKLYKIRKALEEKFDFFTEEEQKRISACEGEVSENGVIIFPNAEKQKEYSIQYKELTSMPIEITVDSITLDLDKLNGKITVDDILALEGLIEIKE